MDWIDEIDWIKGEIPKIAEDFKKHSRTDLKQISDHMTAGKKIIDLEEERSKERTKEINDYEQNRIDYINHLASRIFNKRHGEHTLEHPKPDWASSISWNDCIKRATELVEVSHKGRLQRIDLDNMKKQQQIIEQVRFDRQILKKEEKEICKSFDRQRIDAHHDFENNKVQLVKDAKYAGIENPASYVYNSHKQRIQDLRSKEEHALRQAYQNHGFNYDYAQNSLQKRRNIEM
jgi:hypothetical protein